MPKTIGHAQILTRLDKIKRRGIPDFPTTTNFRMLGSVNSREVHQKEVTDFMEKFAQQPSKLKSFICAKWPEWSPSKSEETMTIGDSQGRVLHNIIPNYSPELGYFIDFASVRGMTQKVTSHERGFNIEWTFPSSYEEMDTLSDVPPYRLCGEDDISAAFKEACFLPLLRTAAGLLGIRGEAIVAYQVIG